jgi:hypothetical protein
MYVYYVSLSVLDFLPTIVRFKRQKKFKNVLLILYYGSLDSRNSNVFSY